MDSHNVVNELYRNGFYYLGVIDDNEPDYMELLDGDWYLGVICCENLLVAVRKSIGWGLNCIGESDTENRWNTTKKLIRTALKQLPLAA